MKYGEKVIETPVDDTTTKIRHEGYYDGLHSVTEKTREDIRTTYQNMLADVIKCLDVLKTTDTPYLLIEIKKDKYGSPNLIQKTWITKKEKIK